MDLEENWGGIGDGVATVSHLLYSQPALPWNVFEQLCIRRITTDEEEESLDGLDRLVTGESASDDIDLVEVLFGEKKLLAAGSREEDIDGGIDTLVADLAIQDELHIARSLEFLKDKIIHAAVGINKRGCHDGERTCLLGIARGGEELAWYLHSAGIHTAAHRATSSSLGIVEGTPDAGEGVHEHKNILALLNEPLGAIHGDLRDAGVAAEIAVIGTGIEFGLRDGATDFSNLFGTLIDK